MLAQGLVSLTVSVTSGLTTGLVLDFLRARLKAKGKETPAEIIERELADGERVLIARAKAG